MTTLIKTNREQTKEYLQTSNYGAIIIGKPGVGKTTLIRQPRMVSASVLAMEFQASGLDAVKAIINSQIQYQNRTVIIDDLGLEDDVKHYGNGLDPIGYVVQRIYDINQMNPDTPIKLIFTTNLDKKELTSKYGTRVVDRIWEMCDRIQLEDTCIRKEPKPTQTTQTAVKPVAQDDEYSEYLEDITDQEWAHSEATEVSTS